MIGRIVNREAPGDPARTVAWIRLAAVPVVFAGERLVDHPQAHSAPFDAVLVAAAVYALAAFVAAHRGPAVRPWIYAALDLGFVCALTYTSGGPFSQLRFAFFLLPVAAAALLRPRLTAAVSVVVVLAYAAISLLHPETDRRDDALAFEVAQAFFLAWMGVAATLLSRMLAKSAREVEALAASRNRLVAQALQAEDRERRLLAEALHDEAIQNLLAVRQEVAAGNGFDRELARVGLDRTVEQLREAVFELHPYLLEHGGLGAALRAVAEQQGRRAGFETDVVVEADAEGVDDRLLFSVGRELVTNAAKHAHASHVRVDVRREPGGIVIEVADDGRGVDIATLSAKPLAGHIGLASCAERLEAVGGGLELSSAAGTGFRAVGRLPVRVPAEA